MWASDSYSARSLVEADAPPIDEVALAVQFRDLERMTAVHYGQIYEEFRTEYPSVEEREPLPIKLETFGRRSSSRDLAINFTVFPPLRRIWLLSEDRHRLLQFQNNRFISNWRKIKGEGSYPRFNSILPSFVNDWKKLKHAIEKYDMGSLTVTQCEMTYFNNISIPDDQAYDDVFSNYFCNWRSLQPPNLTAGAELTAEFSSFRLQHVLTMPGDMEPSARIYVETIPAVQDDGKPFIRFQLIGRGLPPNVDDNGIVSFFEVIREAIVREFVAVTTPKAHQDWGLRETDR